MGSLILIRIIDYWLEGAPNFLKVELSGVEWNIIHKKKFIKSIFFYFIIKYRCPKTTVVSNIDVHSGLKVPSPEVI